MWNSDDIDGPLINRQDLQLFAQLVRHSRIPASIRSATRPLVIVACGKAKIWDKNKLAGPTCAEDAYVGAHFLVNRDYARRFGARWVILSAKYGYIDPHFMIPEPYDVTFKDPQTRPSLRKLRQQVRSMGLARFQTVIGLGGKEYREAIRETFDGSSSALCFPTQGLPIGRAMQRLKRTISHGSIMAGATQ